MTTYTVEYTMYFFDEPNFEGYFEVEAERRDSDRHVTDVYERVDN
jgi:hypothetical protein